MKFGISFNNLHPAQFLDMAVLADDLGFESAWMAEHLVLPVAMAGSPVAGSDHPPVPPSLPLFDAPAYLCAVAARTQRLRVGTFVYLLGLRSPFVAARAFATLDTVSQGRAVMGVGAGWLRSEFEAVGVDFSTRGRRLDEAIGVVRRLWTEREVAHDGEFFHFDPVMFEPKPVQPGGPPIMVGGETPPALRRAGRLGDGWLGMGHDPASAARHVAEVRAAAEQAGRDPGAIEMSVIGRVAGPADVEAYRAAGIDRLIVMPWERPSKAADGLVSFAERCVTPVA